MKCEYCGRNNKSNDALCNGCGASLPIVPQENQSITINNTIINNTKNITINKPTQSPPLMPSPSPLPVEKTTNTSPSTSKEKKIFIVTVIFIFILYGATQVGSPLSVYIVYSFIYAMYLCYQLLINKIT